MKLNKLAPFIALALATTLAGCNFDGSSSDSGSSSGGSSSGGGDTSGGGTVVETSPLAGGYWEIGSSSEAATLSGVATYADVVDLPNVYVFENGKQYYYDDDASFGTYTVTESEVTDDPDAGTLSFTYYGDGNGGTSVSGDYAVTSDTLTIDTAAYGQLTGTDQAANDAVVSAVDAAKDASGLNNYAHILDTKTDDTGELRYKLSDDGSITTGKVTLDFILQVDPDSVMAEASKSAYISLYGDGTSNSNIHGELILSDGKIKYRNSEADQVEILDMTYTLGEKIAIETSWAAGTFSASINGTAIPGIAAGPGAAQAVTTIAVRLGDNGSTNNLEVFADNLKIYNGSEIIFEDNFDNYTLGEVLDGTDDPYNNNSSEATVVSASEISAQ